MIQKKIGLLGAPGVGKTSLVRRFVHTLFDDKYLTTIGVKVDKKLVRVGESDVTLMLWDVAGAEEHFSVPSSYVRGAAGYLLVVDGTRPSTLECAGEILAQIDREIGKLPFVLVLNKIDLADQWKIGDADLAPIAARANAVIRSSAKTGVGVERAFMELAGELIR